MKAPPFVYRRPETLDEALHLLADGAGEAQVLAGGQSLMPTLNMRLSSPGMLVDINRIDELGRIEQQGDGIRIGALVRHREVLESGLIVRRVPLLAMAIPHVAHLAVRNRGTTCGSLALADPSAEMPAVAVALDAQIELKAKSGSRRVAARDFFLGLYETARREDEMMTEVVFPGAASDEHFGFAELSRRHGDFAVVGIAVKAKLHDGALTAFSIVMFGSEPMPLLSTQASGIAIDRDDSDAMLRDIAHAITAEMDPIDNHQGRPETKRQQGAVLLHRVLKDMQTRAFGARHGG